MAIDYMPTKLATDLPIPFFLELMKTSSFSEWIFQPWLISRGLVAAKYGYKLQPFKHRPFGDTYPNPKHDPSDLYPEISRNIQKYTEISRNIQKYPIFLLGFHYPKISLLAKARGNLPHRRSRTPGPWRRGIPLLGSRPKAFRCSNPKLQPWWVAAKATMANVRKRHVFLMGRLE